MIGYDCGFSHEGMYALAEQLRNLGGAFRGDKPPTLYDPMEMMSYANYAGFDRKAAMEQIMKAHGGASTAGSTLGGASALYNPNVLRGMSDTALQQIMSRMGIQPNTYPLQDQTAGGSLPMGPNEQPAQQSSGIQPIFGVPMHMPDMQEFTQHQQALNQQVNPPQYPGYDPTPMWQQPDMPGEMDLPGMDEGDFAASLPKDPFSIQSMGRGDLRSLPFNVNAMHDTEKRVRMRNAGHEPGPLPPPDVPMGNYHPHQEMQWHWRMEPPTPTGEIPITNTPPPGLPDYWHKLGQDSTELERASRYGSYLPNGAEPDYIDPDARSKGAQDPVYFASQAPRRASGSYNPDGRRNPQHPTPRAHDASWQRLLHQVERTREHGPPHTALMSRTNYDDLELMHQQHGDSALFDPMYHGAMADLLQERQDPTAAFHRAVFQWMQDNPGAVRGPGMIRDQAPNWARGRVPIQQYPGADPNVATTQIMMDQDPRFVHPDFDASGFVGNEVVAFPSREAMFQALMDAYHMEGYPPPPPEVISEMMEIASQQGQGPARQHRDDWQQANFLSRYAGYDAAMYAQRPQSAGPEDWIGSMQHWAMQSPEYTPQLGREFERDLMGADDQQLGDYYGDAVQHRLGKMPPPGTQASPLARYAATPEDVWPYEWPPYSQKEGPEEVGDSLGQVAYGFVGSVAGGIGGGLAGTALGGPFGGIVGGAVGGAAGDWAQDREARRDDEHLDYRLWYYDDDPKDDDEDQYSPEDLARIRRAQKGSDDEYTRQQDAEERRRNELEGRRDRRGKEPPPGYNYANYGFDQRRFDQARPSWQLNREDIDDIFNLPFQVPPSAPEEYPQPAIPVAPPTRGTWGHPTGQWGTPTNIRASRYSDYGISRRDARNPMFTFDVNTGRAEERPSYKQRMRIMHPNFQEAEGLSYFPPHLENMVFGHPEWEPQEEYPDQAAAAAHERMSRYIAYYYPY